MPPENVAAMAEVQRSVSVPLATGERLFGRHGFRELLERQAVRIIQPDIARTGGITEFKKIAAMADTYYVSVAPHNPNGPICTIASIHACLSIPNFLVLEFFEPDEPVFREIIDGGLRREKAAVYPPAGPGLGVRISRRVPEEAPLRRGADPGDGTADVLRSDVGGSRPQEPGAIPCRPSIASASPAVTP